MSEAPANQTPAPPLATTTTTVTSPGRPPVTVKAAVDVSAEAIQSIIEREVTVIQKLAAIPFLGTIKALFVIACLVSGYVAYQSRDQIIGAIARSVERHTEQQHETALRDALAQHKALDIVLASVRTSLHSSRALLFQFHNGQSSLKGLPFLYQSETAESVAPGVSDEHDRMQRMPIYLVVDWLPAFLRGECVEQVYETANSSLQAAMSQTGARAVYACPVIVEGDAEPAGYVSVSYTQGWDPPAFADARRRLQDASALIGATLRVYLDKRG